VQNCAKLVNSNSEHSDDKLAKFFRRIFINVLMTFSVGRKLCFTHVCFFCVVSTTLLYRNSCEQMLEFGGDLIRDLDPFWQNVVLLRYQSVNCAFRLSV